MMSGHWKEMFRFESAARVATGAALFMIVLDMSIVSLALGTFAIHYRERRVKLLADAGQ